MRANLVHPKYLPASSCACGSTEKLAPLTRAAVEGRPSVHSHQAFRPDRCAGPSRGISSDASDGSLGRCPRPLTPRTASFPVAARRKLGATKRGQQRPEVPSLASRPSVSRTGATVNASNAAVAELCTWRQNLRGGLAADALPRVSPAWLPAPRLVRPPGCFDCRMGALH